MRLPKAIKVGCHEYAVKYPHVFEVGQSLGMTDLNANTISIADEYNGKKLPYSQVVKTLIHEILHVIDDLSGHNAFKANEEWNEAALDAWAEWLCMVLTDNPELLRLFRQ